MNALEARYRRLLRVYPAAHRADYEEEMIGVLMDGSEPGRRFPALRDTVDLLRAGVAARLGRTSTSATGELWRDAAGIAGLVTVALVTVAAIPGVVRHVSFVEQVMPPVLAHLVLRVLLWAGVATAALCGARRTAGGFAVAATLVEFGALLNVLLPDGFRAAMRMTWSPLTAGIAAGLVLMAVRGRPVRQVLGRRWPLWLSAWGVACAGWLAFELFPGLPSTESVDLVVWVVAAGVLWRSGPGVRGRALVLFATALSAVVSWETAWVHYLPTGMRGPRWDLVAQFVIPVGLPAAVFAGGALVLWAGSAFRRVARR